ncbi:MAG TPA: hypothetical protein PJ997_00975 [Candidatus Paceibacterota bacterium]|nr:hypothetical protein [Candidatus Paceibacterota bacterium]HMP18895.1 hypothetical protein [Candidatus Paceibacterota bacterium]HMP85056.1 hypothetical protein [Candidatus Paceibacterota bacterium]
MKTEKITLSREQMHQRHLGIMLGKIVPQNRIENQMRLVADYARIIYADTPEKLNLESGDFRNQIMFDWAKDGDESLSRYYKDIEDSDEFYTHHRIKGNILNITIQDVLYFKDNGRLPEH